MASAAPGMSFTWEGWVSRWTCSMTVPSRSRKTALRMPIEVCLSIVGRCRLKTRTTELCRCEAASPHVLLGLLEHFHRANVLMIALPQPAIHAADEGRQHVEAQIEFVHIGHFVIGRRGQSINAAVG